MSPYFLDESVTLHHGDALQVLSDLPSSSVDCCVTSPPYFGLRDYGTPGQYGLEATPAAYVETMRAVFAEVHRVLAADGTLWLNLGDSYAGKANGGETVGATRGRSRNVAIPKRTNTTGAAKYKSLLGMPWRVAFALVDDGWTLRNAIVWHKPNAMPESIADRLSTRHELVFLLSKSPRYWFDVDAIKVETTGRAAGQTAEHKAGYGRDTRLEDAKSRRFGGNASSTLLDVHETRNPGDVWSIATAPFAEAHFACMPPALAERCVLAGCKPGGVVLDPFSGSGTTGMVATRSGRRYVGVDLNADYLDLSLRTRLAQTAIVDEVGA